ncbi:MAG: pilus assembly protein PilP [Desulfotignum sp.]|nr:pilus assembly protein PilP [Desulfotignum sp.]
MEKQSNRWMLFLCMMLVVVLLSACEKPPAEESAKKPSVVSHTMPSLPRDETPLSKKIDTQKDSQPKEKKVTQTPVKKDQAQQAQDESEAARDAIEVLPVQAPLPLETDNKKKENEDKEYVTKSQLDPFMPLIQEQKQTPLKTEKQDKPLRVLTPLEKMDLSQIKLVAVVITDSRKIAMVEEPTGKGYEVKIGTYMGKNGGQVVDITFESIVVKEKVTDFKGDQTERFQEIKLHKTDNGE